MPLPPHFAVKSVQTSEIVANVKFIDIDYGPNCWCLRKLDLCFVHYYLHIRRDGNATFWKKLRGLVFTASFHGRCLPSMPHLAGAADFAKILYSFNILL